MEDLAIYHFISSMHYGQILTVHVHNDVKEDTKAKI